MMKFARFCSVLLAVLLLAGTAWGEASVAPGPKDRCPVCGMFVAPYPAWVSVVEFHDGSREFFDGPKDMFVFLFDLPTYRPRAKLADIKAIRVTEYYTTRQMPAQEAFFVVGSDVRGPMGDELVPIQGRDNAETFRRDHGGAKIMRFDGEKLTELPAAQ